jgi:hypothetical protein
MSSIYNDLSIRDNVIVTSKLLYIHPSWKNKEFNYHGIVKNIIYDYINKGVPNWGTEKNVYIEFIDKSAYHNLLLQGSNIMCFIKGTLTNCHISFIEKNDTSITKILVSKNNNDLYNIYNLSFEITERDIDSMLITDKAYSFVKI